MFFVSDKNGKVSITNLLPTFQLSSSVIIKSEESMKNTNVCSQALLRIHIVGGQRSVRIAPPFLSPHRYMCMGIFIMPKIIIISACNLGGQ